jgi:enoyl-CoA hydratase/carnithine racemase
MASEEPRGVLTGAGDKAFSAGADLKSPPNNLYRAIPGVGVPVDKPVIGAVAGWVVGGGMVLTTMCDILSRPTHALLLPGGEGGLHRRHHHQPRLAHPAQDRHGAAARRRAIDAKRAYEVGYVNKVVPVAELMTAALDYALPHRRHARCCPRAR